MLLRHPLPVHNNNFDNSEYGRKQVNNNINNPSQQQVNHINNKKNVEMQSFSPSAPSLDLLDPNSDIETNGNIYISEKQPLVVNNNHFKNDSQLRQRKPVNQVYNNNNNNTTDNRTDLKKLFNQSKTPITTESVYPSLEPSAPVFDESSSSIISSASSSSSNPNSQVIIRPSQVLSLIPYVGPKQFLNEQFYANEKYPSVCFIRHVVTDTSDLTDLAVKYGCTVSDIRRHNRRVVFDYLDNLLGEYIHIPISKELKIGLPEQEPLDEKQTLELAERANINRQHQAIQSFLSIVEKRYYENNGLSHEVVSNEEAQFYLEDHLWNVSSAVAQYFDDIAWEQKKLGKTQKITFHEKKTHNPSSTKSNFNNKPYDNIDYSANNNKNNVPSLLQSKPKTSPASAILSMAAARQAKLTSLVQQEEARLKLEKEKEMLRQAEVMKKTAAKQQSNTTNNNTNTNNNNNNNNTAKGSWYTYNGHKYSKVADSEGFFALPSNNNMIETAETDGYVDCNYDEFHSPKMQEMTVINSNNNTSNNKQ